MKMNCNLLLEHPFLGRSGLGKSLDGMYPHAPPLTAVRRAVSGAFFTWQNSPSWRKWVHSGLFKQIPPQWSALLGSWPMSRTEKSQWGSHLTPFDATFQWSRPDKWNSVISDVQQHVIIGEMMSILYLVQRSRTSHLRWPLGESMEERFSGNKIHR